MAEMRGRGAVLVFVRRTTAVKTGNATEGKVAERERERERERDDP